MALLSADIREQDLKETIFAERRLYIAEHVQSLSKDIDRLNMQIGFGKPAVEIIRHVMAFHHDLVIPMFSLIFMSRLSSP